MGSILDSWRARVRGLTGACCGLTMTLACLGWLPLAAAEVPDPEGAALPSVLDDPGELTPPQLPDEAPEALPPAAPEPAPKDSTPAPAPTSPPDAPALEAPPSDAPVVPEAPPIDEVDRPEPPLRDEDVPQDASPDEDAARLEDPAPLEEEPTEAPLRATLGDEEPTVDRVDDPKRWKHSGFVLEPRIGAVGCTRSLCRGDSGHAATPGLMIGGFLGGNIAGIVELGIEGAWGKLGVKSVQGESVLALYGIDPVALGGLAASFRASGPTSVEALGLAALTVTGDVSMEVANAGPALRVHFLRFGRGSVFVGTGAHWQLWRVRYPTESGRARLDFHGMALPVGGGIGVYPIKHLMIGAEVRYSFTHYLLVVLDHPELSTAAPMSLIDEAAAEAGTKVSSGLPGFWNASATVRVRF
ncbi:MAG: hypothetical protein R3A51_06320 [Nannocystaceae bacterium]